MKSRLKRAIVAIPARNEEERIEPCLRALCRQIGLEEETLGVVVFVNGSSDGTANLIRSMAPGTGMAICLIEDREIRTPDAGWARRMAMEGAVKWFASETEMERPAFRRVILTTDADTIVPPDWVARNLHAIDAGASVVAGAFDIDPEEKDALPTLLRVRLALEKRYEALTTELDCRLHPQPHDPWPRHAATSGTSLAVDLDAYVEVGGMPSMPVGEDRAFVNALIAAGRLVRHDPNIRVRTSGRLIGRAIGGFSVGMRLRAKRWNDPCDERLQPIGRLLGRPAMDASGRASLRPTDLPAEIAKASALLGILRASRSIQALKASLLGLKWRHTRLSPTLSGACPNHPGRNLANHLRRFRRTAANANSLVRQED